MDGIVDKKGSLTLIMKIVHDLLLWTVIGSFFFPELKGIYFEDVDDIKKAVMTKLQKIPEKSFQGRI